MSSLDRAFIRAYAKDQSKVASDAAPAEQTTPEGEGSTLYPSARQPERRYRIEPSAAPWGQSTVRKPHLDFSAVALPDDDMYNLAPPAAEPQAPSVWSAGAGSEPVRLHLPLFDAEPVAPPAPRTAPPQPIIPTQVAPEAVAPAPAFPAPVTAQAPVVSVPVEQPRRPTAQAIPTAAPVCPATPSAACATFEPEHVASPYDSGPIVCLSGMQVPESNYLAALLATDHEPASTMPVTTMPAPVAASPCPAAALAAASPAVCSAPTLEPVAVALEAPVAVPVQPEPAAPPEPVASATPAVVPPAESPVAEVAVEPEAALPANEIPAATSPTEISPFWEVDQFLYPAVCDRLVSEYRYFAQAGEKMKLAAAAGVKVLAITGLGRDEGRTTLAICLARSAASAGLKVGLIDCDFQTPALAHQLGLEVSAGWQSVALDELALPEVAVRSVDDQITLLPLIGDRATAGLHLGHAQVGPIIAQAAASLDVVLLDIGPLDPALCSPGCELPFDAAIVVWDRRHRTLEAAQAAAQLLSRAGIEAVGIAENFVAPAESAAH
jgi:Mrp family chromosome partitioning ATPase